MPVLEWKTGEIVAGGLVYNRRKRTIRACREVIEILRRDLITPAFGELSGRFPSMISFPVPGRTDQTMVVMITRHPIPPEAALDEPLAGWMSGGIGDGCPKNTITAVGLLTPDGGSSVRIEGFPDRWGLPYGIFRFWPAFMVQKGELILPFVRVSPGLKVSGCPEADEMLQGMLDDGGDPVPVSGFRAWFSQGASVPLHPAALRESPHESGWLTVGFLLWADRRAGLALWGICETYQALPAWHRYHLHERLELVDLGSMELIWRLDRIRLDRTVALPDGRWATVRRPERISGWEADEEILIGVREQFVTLKGLGAGSGMMGACTLSDGRWALVNRSWLLILHGMEEEDRLELPLHPLFYLPDALATSDADSIVVIRERAERADELRMRMFSFRAGTIRSRGELGVIRSRTGNGFVLLPAGRAVWNTEHLPGQLPDPFAIGDSGYAIVDTGLRERTGMIRIRFFDPDRQEFAGHFIENLSPAEKEIDFIEILTVSGMFLLVMAVMNIDARLLQPDISLLLLLFDRRGQLVNQRRIDGLSGDLRLLGVSGVCVDPENSFVIMELAGKEKDMTICAAISSSGFLEISIVA